MDFTEGIIPLALMALESLAHLAFGLVEFWLRTHSGSRNKYLLLKTGSLDNAIQDFFIGLAIMVYEPIYHKLQIR